MNILSSAISFNIYIYIYIYNFLIITRMIYIYIYKITTINFDKMKETDAIEIRGYVRKTPRNVRILCTN